MTEIEYHQAVASAKPIQMFLMGKDASITVGGIENDPKGFTNLIRFKERVLKDHTCKFFSDPQDLATKVMDTLSK